MKSSLTKFALSASIMLAMAFTLSCSSGDEGNNGGDPASGSMACKVSAFKGKEGVVVCNEMSFLDNIPSEQINESKKECTRMGGENLSNCPSGYKETCLKETKYGTKKIYLYFNIADVAHLGEYDGELTCLNFSL
jgi:hypothetical protein